MSVDAWTCPTCNEARQTAFCPACGEKPLHGHDLTLVGLLEQGVEAITHLDGRVFKTFRTLVTRPGALTAGYLRGQRRAFIGPLPTFLIANVFFFAMQTLFSANVFSNPLRSQTHDQFYSDSVVPLVQARIAALHTTEALYAPVFDHAVVVNAKSMIILMTPPLTLLAALLFVRSRQPLVGHVVFSIHFYAFWLVVFSVLLPLMIVMLGGTFALVGISLSTLQWDTLVSSLLVSVAGVYLYAAVGRVYGARGILRLVNALLLMAVAGLTVIAYRLVVFLITLYTTAVH